MGTFILIIFTIGSGVSEPIFSLTPLEFGSKEACINAHKEMKKVMRSIDHTSICIGKKTGEIVK